MLWFIYYMSVNYTMAPAPLERLKELNTTDCLWLYVLRILKDGPAHAYSIRGEIEKRYGFRPGNMTAYKVLYLLNRDGLVTKKREGRKKVYAVTEKGSKELSDAVRFYRGRAKLLGS